MHYSNWFSPYSNLTRFHHFFVRTNRFEVGHCGIYGRTVYISFATLTGFICLAFFPQALLSNLCFFGCKILFFCKKWIKLWLLLLCLRYACVCACGGNACYELKKLKSEFFLLATACVTMTITELRRDILIRVFHFSRKSLDNISKQQFVDSINSLRFVEEPIKTDAHTFQLNRIKEKIDFKRLCMRSIK